MEKTCTKCGESKLLSEYHKKKAGKYGRDSKCKLCKKAYNKKYRKSESAKKALKKYRETGKYIETKKKYEKSEAGKVTKKKIRHQKKEEHGINHGRKIDAKLTRVINYIVIYVLDSIVGLKVIERPVEPSSTSVVLTKNY